MYYEFEIYLSVGCLWKIEPTKLNRYETRENDIVSLHLTVLNNIISVFDDQSKKKLLLITSFELT